MMYRRKRCTFLTISVLFFICLTPRLLYYDHSYEQYSNIAKSLQNASNTIKSVPEISEGNGVAYRDKLVKVADSNGVIILSLVDQGFIDVAINFWEISIRPFGIDNMLFVSLSKKACQVLAKLHIPCHVYQDFSGGKQDSTYMSPVFLKKMNTRTQFILDALRYNFTILNTDSDVIFFKNPLPYLNCSDCHLEILEDGIRGLLNAGFIYLQPTKITAEVYKRMAAIARSNPRSEDQAMLNKVVKKDMKGRIKFNMLDQSKFLSGKKFYEDAKRYFADTAKHCNSCVVVHNNWIVGKAAKIYRQKEMLQWVYDGDKYYSDPDRKYLVYANAINLDNREEQLRCDKSSLIAAFAIGQLLNRTVILPRLHCSSGFCPLNSRFYISHIDDSFGGKYRESVFLQHPKVPRFIKDSLPQTFLIKTTAYWQVPIDKDVIIKQPEDSIQGATSSEIIKWFGDNNESILKFHSLYHAFKGFSSSKNNNTFQTLVKEGFKKAVYRQY